MTSSERAGSRIPCLEAVVLICGAGTMALEMTGSRLLAPYLGTSIFVWTSLIGVILAFLSVGYWFGGRVADLKPERSVLSALILGAAVWTAMVALLGDPVLVVVQQGVRDLRLGAVAATIILFAVPSVLLGMVSPYAVRLKLVGTEHSGATVGRLYALSTVGSIAGTFLAGFILVSHLGTSTVFFVIAAALALASALAWLEGPAAARAAAAAALCVAAGASEAMGQTVRGADFHDVNTPYNRVWIYRAYDSKYGLPIRVMQINDEASSQMYLEGEDLADNYTRYYRLARHFKPDLKRAMMIGGAAYSYPKDFLRQYPDARIDVVEIDPKLTDLAREYFGLRDDPRLGVVHEDARTYLNRSQEKYDAIYADAFKSYSIPFQLTTLEAARHMHRMLTDDGVLIMNIIGSVEGPTGEFVRAEYATLKSVFPQVLLFAAANPEDGIDVQNVMMVALKSERKPKYFSRDRELDEYLRHLWIKPVPTDQPVLTDDFAPVDRYMLPVTQALGRIRVNPVKERWSELLSKYLYRKEEGRA